MKDLKLAITINKPAKEIFDFTLNPKNTLKWVDFIAVEETNEWPPKLGTVYRNRGADDADWSELALTEFEQDRLFTMSKTDGSYHVRYTFTPISPDKTELEYYEWTDRSELSVPFTMEPLQKLKKLLEQSS
jgi:Polyketide cyclase / dehydrase and lipid transport